MTSYKVMYDVVGELSNPLNRKIIEMPIIPRIGDIVEFEFTPEPSTRSNHKILIAGEVKRVSIYGKDQKNADALVRIQLDELE